MDHEFWLERWQSGEIGFHQPKVQPALQAHWPRLTLASDATVLVPLCGKSVDMAWLATSGHRVIGAELSATAVDAFFSEQGVTPSERIVGAFNVKFAHGIELWCGDFFALDAKALPKVEAVYDRAALVAMPPELQPRYAEKIAQLLPAGGQVLLIGLDYNPFEMNGPPFSVPEARVRELFGQHFQIDVLDKRDGLTKSEHLAKRGVTRLEEATYLMKRRT